MDGPVKFSLGGDMGSNIVKSGFPQVTVMSCPSGGTFDPVEQSVTAVGAAALGVVGNRRGG